MRLVSSAGGAAGQAHYLSNYFPFIVDAASDTKASNNDSLVKTLAAFTPSPKPKRFSSPLHMAKNDLDFGSGSHSGDRDGLVGTTPEAGPPAGAPEQTKCEELEASEPKLNYDETALAPPPPPPPVA